MRRKVLDKERNLSEAEAFIMKTIWDLGGEERDVPLGELMKELDTTSNKNYARTTVATFLSKLIAKEFIESYRTGRLSMIHVKKSEKEYRNKILNEQVKFWFKGNKKMMIACLCDMDEENDQTISQIRELLDGMDD